MQKQQQWNQYSCRELLCSWRLQSIYYLTPMRLSSVCCWFYHHLDSMRERLMIGRIMRFSTNWLYWVVNNMWYPTSWRRVYDAFNKTNWNKMYVIPIEWSTCHQRAASGVRTSMLTFHMSITGTHHELRKKTYILCKRQNTIQCNDNGDFLYCL